MEPDRILRFRQSERHLHWALALPFLVCWTTALVLVLAYNPMPLRPYRSVLSWAHRISGLAFILLPPTAVIRSRHDIKVHFNNIVQAWRWTISDVKWLTRMVAAVLFRGVRMPEQGKFNAAEKLNFMIVMSTYPLYVLTGLLMWFTNADWMAWILHVFMALVATPFLLGHLFMALFNRETRTGLQGMISGYVDRTWARHHYRRWYDEEHARTPPESEA
jgi:formate dehydrogenase subunit gamma